MLTLLRPHVLGAEIENVVLSHIIYLFEKASLRISNSQKLGVGGRAAGNSSPCSSLDKCDSICRSFVALRCSKLGGNPVGAVYRR